jgi:DNA-binding NarL/FixJ family response regulator
MRSKAEVPIKVLLADDSDIMRDAIRKLLAEESRIKIVGEAQSFASAMQMIADYKPDILLLDLHLAQKRGLDPHVVKSQLNCVKFTLAVSFSNDDEAKSLAASYGAAALLDKMTLYSQLLPTIERLYGPSPNNAFRLDLKADLEQGGREGLPLKQPE